METKTKRLACGYIEKSMVVKRLVLKASGAPPLFIHASKVHCGAARGRIHPVLPLTLTSPNQDLAVRIQKLRSNGGNTGGSKKTI